LAYFNTFTFSPVEGVPQDRNTDTALENISLTTWANKRTMEVEAEENRKGEFYDN
jgi:hypothetical protein